MRETTLTDWHRRMAAMVAAGNPMTPTAPIRASGNHLVAAQDEPEPDPEEEARQAIRAKAQVRQAQELRFALSLQLQHEGQ